jgi:hypothetical protein
VRGGGKKERRKKMKEREKVVVWISHAPRGPVIDVFGRREKVEVHIVEELYWPGDVRKTEPLCRELAWLRLPWRWKKFLRGMEARLVASHFVQRITPQQEAERLLNVRLLEEIQKMGKEIPHGNKLATV